MLLMATASLAFARARNPSRHSNCGGIVLARKTRLGGALRGRILGSVGQWLDGGPLRTSFPSDADHPIHSPLRSSISLWASPSISLRVSLGIPSNDEPTPGG